jgi:hypothetical protein
LASCLLHNLTGNTETSHPDPSSWHIDEAEAKTRKFVAGILDVIEQAPTEALLERVLDQCAEELSKVRAAGGDDGLAPVVQRVLGQAGPLPEPGMTGSTCVLCGTTSNEELDLQRAVGIKPSGWLPRTPAFQGGRSARICPPCILDARRRAQIVQESQAKGTKDAQYLHVHKSDTAVEGDLADLMREIQPKRIASRTLGVTLYAKGKDDEPTIPFENHVTIPIPACGGLDDQVWLLDNLLSFSYDTGYKVQVTSLGGIPRPHRCMLHWQNAPSWVQELRPHDANGVWVQGFAAVRCDRVPAAKAILRAIRVAAFTNRTGAEANHAPLISTLIENPLGLYRFPCRASKDGGEDPTTTLERYFMTDQTVRLLEKAGHAYCRFNTRDASAWGKSNHWQWATRAVLRNLEVQNDLAPHAARGMLLNEAQRKYAGARAEDVDEFVGAIQELYGAHGQRSDHAARDIIAAVEWTAERLYDSTYSKKARAEGNP